MGPWWQPWDRLAAGVSGFSCTFALVWQATSAKNPHAAFFGIVLWVDLLNSMMLRRTASAYLPHYIMSHHVTSHHHTVPCLQT